MCLPRATLCLLVACAQMQALAVQRGKGEAGGGRGAVRPALPPAGAEKAMARYSLRAYESCDPSNGVRGLLFTPKPGAGPLPMVVYIPGSGETGDLSRQYLVRVGR